MAAPTQYLPAQLVADLHSVLARLRAARLAGWVAEEITAEERLNELIGRLPRFTRQPEGPSDAE
jgi:hypothetical protein